MVHCPTLNFFYYDTLPEKEKDRLQHLEPFDEFEVMIKLFGCNILTLLQWQLQAFLDSIAAGLT